MHDHTQFCIVFYLPETFALLDGVRIFHNEHKFSPMSRIVLYDIINDYQIPYDSFYLFNGTLYPKNLYRVKKLQQNAINKPFLNTNHVIDVALNSAFIGFSHYTLNKIKKNILTLDFNLQTDRLTVGCVLTDDDLRDTYTVLMSAGYVYDNTLGILYATNKIMQCAIYLVWYGWQSTYIKIFSNTDLLQLQSRLLSNDGVSKYILKHPFLGTCYIKLLFTKVVRSSVSSVPSA